MPTPSLFDIMGPIMIGPSSSHTAGAARLGKMAYKLAGGDIREVKMYLHGSFAATYLQSRMLNRGKGPAVHSLRVQTDPCGLADG